MEPQQQKIFSVVILGWGISLWKDNQFLRDLSAIKGINVATKEWIWNPNGPTLKKRDDGSLEAVIDLKNGADVSVNWCHINITIDTYPANEITPSLRSVLASVWGCDFNSVGIGSLEKREMISTAFQNWGKSLPTPVHEMFWLDLEPNFDSFSPKMAVKYLYNTKLEEDNIGSVLQSIEIDSKTTRRLALQYLKTHYSYNSGNVAFSYEHFSKDLAQSSVKLWIQNNTYYGENGFVEYVKGTLPIVFTVPHGGRLHPKSVADRTRGVLEGDDNSLELSTNIYTELANLCSDGSVVGVPHIIICHLDRIKLDANRNMQDAALGDRLAEQSWKEFHNFIEIAKRDSLSTFKFAHVFDMHGNSMSKRTMIGHILRKADYELDDWSITLAKLDKGSSIRDLALKKSSLDAKKSLLVGNESFAALLEKYGLPSTPIGKAPFDWGGPDFFNGGYNIIRHGSFRYASRVNASQVETPIEVRKSPKKIQKFAVAFSKAVLEFFALHYNINLQESIK